MFLTFINNARHFGDMVFKYSWAIGMITAIVGMILFQDVTLSLVVGVFMMIKWGLIGFLTRFVADMFLEDMTKDKK